MNIERLPAWLQFKNENDQGNFFPDELLKQRKKCEDAFLQEGLPTRKQEYWKYADLSFLSTQLFSTQDSSNENEAADVLSSAREKHQGSLFLVFVNGRFSSSLSDINRLPTNLIACSLQTALKEQPSRAMNYLQREIDARRYPFANLNAAQFVDGLFLYLPDHQRLAHPLHLLFIATGDQAFIAHPHHMIILGKNSQLILTEEYISSSSIKNYMMNNVTTMVVHENARCDYYKIQDESELAIHLATTFIEQQADSEMNCTHFSRGSLFARDDLVIRLQAAGATCSANGFYQLHHDDQYIDHHVDISHAADRTTSEMLYKGTLDKKSRGVFNGRLYVEKDQKKIVAHQANHNLLLSPQAEMNAKPELEIYADDVRCQHGATMGQCDREALFYLRSRGMSYEEALAMLLRGFAEDIVQRVKQPAMQKRFQEMVR